MTKFKNKMLQRNYDAMRKAARDPKSELYLANGKPHHGASHRNAYWKGRAGQSMRASMVTMHTLGHAYWAAGRDDLKDLGPVADDHSALGFRG